MRRRELRLTRDDVALVVVALEDMVETAKAAAAAGDAQAGSFGVRAAALVARLRGQERRGLH